MRGKWYLVYDNDKESRVEIDLKARNEDAAIAEAQFIWKEKVKGGNWNPRNAQVVYWQYLPQE